MQQYIKFTTSILEVINYENKLGFIIKDNKFKIATKRHFSDKGFIDKYKVINVIDQFGSVFIVTDYPYLKFSDFELVNSPVECRIDIENRTKLQRAIFFKNKFIESLKFYYPFVEHDYFITENNSYIVVESDEIDIFKALTKLSKLNFLYTIESIVKIEKKIFIYFTVNFYNHIIKDRFKNKKNGYYYEIIHSGYPIYCINQYLRENSKFVIMVLGFLRLELLYSDDGKTIKREEFKQNELSIALTKFNSFFS